MKSRSTSTALSLMILYWNHHVCFCKLDEIVFSKQTVERKRKYKSTIPRHQSNRPRIRQLEEEDDEQQQVFREIWETQAFLAEREAERLLFEDIFRVSSFPPYPTPRPPPSPLPPPTSGCLNGRSRKEFLRDQLSVITPTNILMNPSTPQGQAFEFMNNDPLNPDVCSYPTIDQRYGLATLFYATSGSNWLNSQGWLSNQVECSWNGVSCNNGLLASNLTLPGNNLAGTLPDEISTLHGMTQILLSSNSLSSTIPLGLSNLTQLCVLDLEMNQLTGSPLPPQLLILGNSLKQLFLSDNRFTQQAITEDVQLLRELTDLWLANNGLAGSIPSSIGVLTNLRTLILYENDLTGPIPSEMGNLGNLVNLQLFDNVFVNSLPSAFYDMTQLRVLRIQQNFLTGTISTNLGNLEKLVDVRFDDNFFRGALPSTLGQLSNLQIASFSSTRLSGVIPNIFSNLDNLRILDLALCEFTGSIPTSIFTVPTLEFLYLNGNQLTGNIPTSYSNPPNLKDMYLDNNQLVGTVPAISVGRLMELTEFTVGRNSIGGSMPQSICNLRNSANLETLISDCGGPDPEIQCSFPSCCTSCLQDLP